MAQRIITLILLLCSTSAIAGLFDAPGRSNFVPADQAFAFDFQQNQHDLNLTWQIKDGYYLYRKQIKLTSADAAFSEPSLPAGEWHEDEFYGKSEIYRQRLTVPVTLTHAAAGATLTVTCRGLIRPCRWKRARRCRSSHPLTLRPPLRTKKAPICPLARCGRY